MSLVSARGERDLQRLALAYKAGGPKLRSRIRRELTAEAKPLADYVVQKGSEPMPKRGGLAARLASAKGGVTVSLLGKTTAVTIRIKNSDLDRIKRINKGGVRHPVWGVWRAGVPTQGVPANTYTNAFRERGRETQVAVARAVTEVTREIAAEASNV